MSTSVFDVVEMAPDDPILGLNEAFKTDPRKEKVNLSIGVYCTEEGKVPLLKVVEQTEKNLLKQVHLILIYRFPVYLPLLQAFRN